MDKSNIEMADAPWRSLYKLGGAAALLTVLAGVVEILLTFLPGGNPTGVVTAVDWYALFQGSWFFGLRNLGLVNIFLTILGGLVLFALYGAHRRVNPAYAALVLGISFMGAAVFFATNRAFAMLNLSQQYAAAPTDGQRLVLAAAGQALLAVGQSHTPGTFLAFFLSEVAGIGMSLVMLRGKVFGRASAYAGLAGFGLLLVFEICASFIPAAKAVAMPIAMVGGLASMAWDILVARRLFQLGRGVA
jgi:hypothetical protein